MRTEEEEKCREYRVNWRGWAGYKCWLLELDFHLSRAITYKLHKAGQNLFKAQNYEVPYAACQANLSQAILKITDGMGRIIKLNELDDFQTVNLQNEPNGIYFFIIQTAHQTIVKRIVKG